MSGHTTETAPKRVWLQVNPEAMLDEETGGFDGDVKPFPQEEVTWCWHRLQRVVRRQSTTEET